jgi:2-oxoglutarate ferredoxin oxidoreductase subunit delta
MAKLIINKDKCKGCLLCIRFCPKGCITVDTVLNAKGVTPVIFREDAGCSGCMMCALICPDVCIEIVK